MQPPPQYPPFLDRAPIYGPPPIASSAKLILFGIAVALSLGGAVATLICLSMIYLWGESDGWVFSENGFHCNYAYGWVFFNICFPTAVVVLQFLVLIVVSFGACCCRARNCFPVAYLLFAVPTLAFAMFIGNSGLDDHDDMILGVRLGCWSTMAGNVLLGLVFYFRDTPLLLPTTAWTDQTPHQEELYYPPGDAASLLDLDGQRATQPPYTMRKPRPSGTESSKL